MPLKKGIAFNVVGLHNNTKLAIPDLELQLNQLPMLFKEVCETILLPDLSERLLTIFKSIYVPTVMMVSRVDTVLEISWSPALALK